MTQEELVTLPESKEDKLDRMKEALEMLNKERGIDDWDEVIEPK